jgi:HEAT repeat protein
MALSPARLKAARSSYYIFNALNSFSFIFLAGSFITLFAMKLGASNAVVGLLNSFGYATYFFLPLGKRLVRTHSIVGVFSWGWLLRFFAMIPILASPYLAAHGHTDLALGLILVGVALFNFFRGFALIGNNPVLAFLAEGRDRGAFVVNIVIVNNIAGIATNLLAAFALGKSANLTLYLILIAAGIVVGIVGSLFLFKTPEPESYRPRADTDLWKIAVQSFKEPSLRAFFVVFILASFVAAMARSFLPVYAKELYAQGDNLVMAYSLLTSLGAVIMGLLTRLLVDRIGAKPLYVIFTAVAAASLLPAVVSPAFSSPAIVVIFLGAFNFFSSFGLAGEENAGQTYYFALVPKEQNLDLSVIYFLAYGVGGALGSVLGGVLLEVESGLGLSLANSYRLFFGLLFLILVFVIIRMGKLRRLGSTSIRESLGIILSIRDLRAFNLLARLDRSGDPREEMRLIQEIGRSGSPQSQHELLAYLGSPRFELRMEALLALENLPSLDRVVLTELEAEVRKNPFTTAYIAARILGKSGFTESLPTLREALSTDDYLLQGTAVVALARLDDRAARPEIEELLARSDNPRVRVQAAYALELFGDRASLPVLISSLRKEDPPAYVSDELVLAIASLLGVLGRFYPMYQAFLNDEAAGRAFLEDALADQKGKDAEFGKRFREATASILGEQPRGEAMARLVIETGLDSSAELLLAEAALNQGLSYKGFRFFLAAYVALGATKR